MLLETVRAKKILNSRKEPAIEIQIGNLKSSSPSGKSTGTYETPQFKKSIGWNINFLNKQKFNLEINSFNDLKKVESFIKQKVKLNDVKQFGANALFALESVILKTLAQKQKKELWQVINSDAKKIPIPIGNAIGGGLHSHNKNHPFFQEFLIIPRKKSFKENYAIMKKIYSQLKIIVHANSINDEGAWQTSLNDEQILEKLSLFKNIRIGIDIAANSIYRKNEYCYKNKILDRTTQIHFINDLQKKYNLAYIEDPLQENDFDGFADIHHDNTHFITGDDLTATHLSRLKKSIEKKSINAVIVKPNQNGSLLEVAEIIKFCKKNNIKTILSHRSGETLDDALADFAFGFQTDFIKCGIATKWREVKLKRLAEIENSLKK